MILDSSLLFSNAQAVTVSADSTNTLDLNNNRDVGVGNYELKVLSVVGATFTSATAAATLVVELWGAPNNAGSAGTYTMIGRTPAQPLGFLQAGYKAAQFDVPPVSNSPTPVGGAGLTLTTTATSTSATVSSATGLVQGLEIVSSGLVPGTRIASISGMTITLDTAAASTTSAVSVAFMGAPLPYRFLKLVYTASATMTAGTVTSYLAPSEGVDTVTFYPPGVVVAN